MSYTGYYAPLDEQLAESIRAKYRLLRSRRLKSDLHAASQPTCDFEMNIGMNNIKMNNFKATKATNLNYNYSEDYSAISKNSKNNKTNHKMSTNEYHVANCLRCCSSECAIGVHHLKLNTLHQTDYVPRQAMERCSGNGSEYRKLRSNNQPNKHRRRRRSSQCRSSQYGHTFGAPTNLICESPVLLGVLLAYLATLLSSLFIVNWLFAAFHRIILLPLADCLQAQYKTFSCRSAKIYRRSREIYWRSAEVCSRSTAKLTAFRPACYWMPFVFLLVWFELNDLHFVFLKNFYACLVLYALIFTLPLSIGYRCVFAKWQAFESGLLDRHHQRQTGSSKSLACPRTSGKTPKRRSEKTPRRTSRSRSKSVQRQAAARSLPTTKEPPIDLSLTTNTVVLSLTKKAALLGLINRTVSLTLLCLIDYTLMRNGLRALRSARELSIAYLVESLVDNIMNYDQPKFNYLPEEENLSADKLNLLSSLTVFSLLRLTHSLSRLFFMDANCSTQKVDRTDLCGFNQKNFGEYSNSQSLDYKSKLRSYQNTTRQRQETKEIQTRNTFESSFEFLFITLRPILLGSLSYIFLFATKLFCHLLIASLVLLGIGLAIAVIDLEIGSSKVDSILESEFVSNLIEKLSNWLCSVCKNYNRTSNPIHTIRLPNHLVLQNLFELTFIFCLHLLIGPSPLLSFTLIAQLAFTYINFKRKLLVLSTNSTYSNWSYD